MGKQGAVIPRVGTNFHGDSVWVKDE